MTDNVFFEPRAHIPLFRGVVKDCCASIVQIAMLTVPLNMGPPLTQISQIVERQLSQYHYIYPTSGHVSFFFWGRIQLIFHQGNPITAPALCARPYRNPWMISVIRQLYFEGSNAFVHRFEKCVHFLIYGFYC